jgi:voltage-gated potassium channel
VDVSSTSAPVAPGTGAHAVRSSLGTRVAVTMLHIANHTPSAVAVYLGAVLAAATAVAVLEGWPFGDAVWWAFVTTTTTGYGDLSPATAAGRVIAVVTMFVGIVGIGVIVGRIAAVVIRTRDDFTHEEQVEISEESDEQLRLLREIQARLEAGAVAPTAEQESAPNVPGD